MNINVFGIVKDDKHNTKAISYSGGEVSLSKYDDAFKLLIFIQDEMHRFAISYARSKHIKKSIHSSLTNVKGIGDKKAIKIMLHFKTLDALKSANIQELKSVAGVNQEVANALFEFIQNDM